ncbi:PID-CTERM protein-sorting domain-containing protein [Neotamlana laminarinivorans]|uniref:Uncharacterized protein n=1 Tax=Neotamlana laminarinivorans TaxID=2883124 RepID=A0A9X1L330_9FLAO|nr:hypothetical protein [Tamlana laminarinivorans]MCB4798239.1 hypothetical protein [Tamlana laminarinivorans]
MQNKRIFASILFVLISLVCLGQKTPPPPSTPAPGPGFILPIDGGVLLGAFFAIIYGVKKMVFNKK